MSTHPIELALREQRLQRSDGAAFSLHGTTDAVEVTARDSYGRVWRCVVRRVRGVYACTDAATVSELAVFLEPSLGELVELEVEERPSCAATERSGERDVVPWTELVKATMERLNPEAELMMTANEAVHDFIWMVVRKVSEGVQALPREAQVPGMFDSTFFAPMGDEEDTEENEQAAALRAHIGIHTVVVGERQRHGTASQLYLVREVDDFSGWVGRDAATAVLGAERIAEWDLHSNEAKAAAMETYCHEYYGADSAEVGVRAVQLTVRQWLRGPIGYEAIRKGTEAVARFTASECCILDDEAVMRASGLNFPPSILKTELSAGYVRRPVDNRAVVYLAAVLQYLTEHVLDAAGEECARHRARYISGEHIRTSVQNAPEISTFLADSPPGRIASPERRSTAAPPLVQPDMEEVRTQARMAQRNRSGFNVPPVTSDFWLPVVPDEVTGLQTPFSDDDEDDGPCCSICLEPGRAYGGQAHVRGFLWTCPADREHFACQDCFTRHVHARLEQGMSVITCPCGFTDCMHEVPELMVRNVLTNAEGEMGPVHTEYSQAMAALEAPREGASSHPAGGGLKGAVKLRWALIGTRKCPRCKRRIKKNGGCDHMTCLCGHEMCWRCGGDWCKNGRRGHNFDLFPSRSELKYCCNDKKQNLKRVGAVTVGLPLGIAAATTVLAGAIVYGTGKLCCHVGVKTARLFRSSVDVE